HDKKSAECFKVIELIFNDANLKKSNKGRYAKRVSELFKNGYDLNIKNEEGQPLIKWCYEQGYKELFSLLLEMGADINQQDDNGDTVLMSVCKNGDETTVETLFEQREDVDIYLQDKNGLTVEDMALNNCQSAILIRILDYAESLANTDDTASQ
ncbi:MAG: ankyrin repeat domain-containing protein, partial [Endozoicomonadaceae bacterium]|nr:ankyrin repeat domain-containing protein [Endozoicomonadaceae bacterium]